MLKQLFSMGYICIFNSENLHQIFKDFYVLITGKRNKFSFAIFISKYDDQIQRAIETRYGEDSVQIKYGMEEK